MSHVLKALVQRGANRLGLEIRRKPDLHQLALYREQYDAPTLARKPFYNVGSGAFWHPHWTNLDYVSDWYQGVQREVIHYDLLSGDPLPIESGTAEVIYTAHTVNHVPEDAVARLFGEAYRALRPGGVLRVTSCADATLDHRALVARDERWFYWDEAYAARGTWEDAYRAPATSVPLEERWLHHTATQLAPNHLGAGPTTFDAAAIRQILAERGRDGALDYLTGLCSFDPKWPGNHMSWWTPEKLVRFARDAGFENAYRSGYGQSVLPILRNVALFDDVHWQVTGYMEAVR